MGTQQNVREALKWYKKYQENDGEFNVSSDIEDIEKELMDKFKQYPGIKLNLDLGSTNDVIRRVSEDEGEIGLVYNPPGDPKIVSRAIKRQPMMAIVKPNFLRSSKTKSMSVQELATYPIAATHPTYGTRQMLQAVEFAEKIRLEPVVTTNSISLLKQFAMSGLGLAVLPAFAVTTEVEAGTLLAIEIDHPILMKAEAHLVTRVGRKLSVASNKMLQLMSSQMQAFR